MGEKAFNRADYMTVKEFAQTVEKSQQSIYKRIERKENRGKYLRSYEGRKYIHKAALWDLYGIDTGFNAHVSDEEATVEQDTESLLVKVLRDELAKRDKTIEGLNRQIDDASRRYDELMGMYRAERNQVLKLTDKLEIYQIQIEDKTATHTDTAEDPSDREPVTAAEDPSDQGADITDGGSSDQGTDTAADLHTDHGNDHAADLHADQENSSGTANDDKADRSGKDDTTVRPKKRRSFLQWLFDL